MNLTNVRFRNQIFDRDNFILNLSTQEPRTLLNMDLTNDYDLATALLLGFFNDSNAFDEYNRKRIEEGLWSLSKSTHDDLMFTISDEMSKCWDNLGWTTEKGK